MYHKDMSHRGSQFTVMHPPLRSRNLFIALVAILSSVAFSAGLHLHDKKILAKICIVLVVCILIKLGSKIHSESVLILPSLGLQVETRYWLGCVSTNFICLSQIKDIVINEAVTMHSILAYLVVLLNEEESDGKRLLYPLFNHSWPPVAELKPVYQACQQKLLNSKIS